MSEELQNLLLNFKDVIALILGFILAKILLTKLPETIDKILKYKEQEKVITTLSVKVEHLERDIQDIKHDISELRKWYHDLYMKDIRSGGI